MAIGFSQVDSAFSTFYFLKNKNKNERARRGWGSTQTRRRPVKPEKARKTGEGPQNPEKARKKYESVLFGDV